MTKLLMALFLVAASSSFACDQYEAQFIGKVIKHRKAQSSYAGYCVYEISYSMFNYSQVCPLDQVDVAGVIFPDPECRLKDGQQVSGILVKKDDSVYIE